MAEAADIVALADDLPQLEHREAARIQKPFVERDLADVIARIAPAQPRH